MTTDLKLRSLMCALSTADIHQAIVTLRPAQIRHDLWRGQCANELRSDSINETRAGRLFERSRQRPILLAVGPADRSYPAQMILRRIAVALLNLPQTVILPRQHMVWIGFQRALVPGLRQLVVAEFAIGI